MNDTKINWIEAIKISLVFIIVMALALGGGYSLINSGPSWLNIGSYVMAGVVFGGYALWELR